MQIREFCLISSLLLTALSGCTVPTDIKPSAHLQEANTLVAGRDLQNSPAAGPWPQSAWWESFGDPQLDALIDRAIASSPRLAMAADRIKMAQVATNLAHAGTQPSVRAEAAATHIHLTENEVLPPPEGGGDFWDNSAQLAFSYELDLWGRDAKIRAGSLADEQVSRYEAQVARLALAGAIVRSYAALALQYELQDNSRAILDDQEHTLSVTQRRVAAGIGTELESQEFIADIAATRATLEQIDARITVLRHALGALSGAGPGAGDSLSRPALHTDQIAQLPTAIPADLVGRRPDVLAQRWRVERSDATIGLSKTAFYPNINLHAFAGQLSFGFSKFLDASSENTGFGPAISLPLFDAGARRDTLQLRTLEFDAAVHAYNATLIDALTDIADQIASFEALARISQQRSAALRAAERAHQLALEAFRAGLTDSLNVLHTQTTLSTQRNQLADVHFQQMTTWAALNQALGGGLVDAAGKTEPTP